MEMKKQRFVLRRWIDKEEQRSYLEVPFAVEGAVERIDIAYRYEREAAGGAAVVDIGLRSPKRIVGWSGGAREAFFVGTEKATPGYLAEPIVEGEWAVLLGAYKIPEGGAEVIIEVELTRPHGRWMKGDLHMHSVHSDGSYTIGQAKESCKARGLEFMALTDHNTTSQNHETLVPDEELLVIPGVELTSYFGHANVLGVSDALMDFRVTTSEQAGEVLGEARKRGGFVSLNHPFCPSCPWELGFDLPYDAIEVWNGPWRGLNERALAWWQGQLAQGHRLIALGGSDAHREERFVKHGRPTASVWAETDTAQGVLAGIRQGRVVLQFDPDETCLALTAGEYGIGQTIPLTAVDGKDGIPLTINVCGAKGDRVALWSDRGIEAIWDIADSHASIEARQWEQDAAEAGGWTVQREVAEILEFDAPDNKNCAPWEPDAVVLAGAVAPRTVEAENGQVLLEFHGSSDRLFYRLEARRSVEGLKQSAVTCLTNPIYIEQEGRTW
ncbi:CehA/McbA family metallohydrolase [Paenibacillus glycanilyticus]|uniref:CehA/McbA family metallohydrolase n=1 Tax=Paenibacillus glycanilyticus TaxID=126569 RepID=UPI00203CB072|nr:CehA/McbA family metallohydrolase [Paenibacillus glycanilyticus]MCM3628468.1 CehA/McbA family metallohydrolase [Paenibacillus glycanilyticus]